MAVDVGGIALVVVVVVVVMVVVVVGFVVVVSKIISARVTVGARQVFTVV